MLACLVLSLEYIHKKRVIHRDIKPENLVFDHHGYLYLTDFGISRIKRSGQDNSKDTSGTPGYMAPEVLNTKPHSFNIDFYAMGITMYEIINKKRPFRGDKKAIREQINEV
jgi:serine/threonine protein kinase